MQYPSWRSIKERTVRWQKKNVVPTSEISIPSTVRVAVSELASKDGLCIELRRSLLIRLFSLIIQISSKSC